MARKRYTRVSSFGEILQKLRREAGVSQAALAKRAGMSGSLIALMELNRRTPRKDKVEALAGALALNQKKRNRLLLAAGYSTGGSSHAVFEQSRVIKALEELMNDPKLNPKQKLAAESLLEAFIYWVQDRMVKGRL